MYTRFSMYDRKGIANPYFENLATGVLTDFDSYNGVVDYTSILSASTVLDVRFGYNRYVRHNDGNPDGGLNFDLTKVGLPAKYNSMISETTRRFPRIDITNYIGTGFTGEYRPVDTASFSAGLSRTLGSHMMRAGFDARAYRENDVLFSNDQTMRMIFDSAYTKGPQDNSPTSPNSIGQSVAALLLGIPNTSSYVSRTADYAEQSMTYGFYFQDDWKLTPKLTLNLGLRWEFETPLTERFNRSVAGFNPIYAQPFGAAAEAAYAASPALAGTSISVKGGLLFSNGNQLYATPKRNLMPRIGFAYQLPRNSVVRGGFGTFDGFLGERRGDVIQSGYTRQTTFNAFGSDGATIIAKLADPFPNGILEPLGSSQGGQTYVGQNISFFNQNPRTPTNYRWQLNFQHQLGSGILLEAGYVGNKAVRIEITRNINGLPLKYLSTAMFRDNATNATLTGSVNNPFYGLSLPIGTPTTFTAKTISVQQLLLPYPQFGAINTTTNEGYSWYHGLQLRAEKRFSHGLTVNANYTYSKLMSATDLLNATDPRPTETIGDQDTPHRITTSAIYVFPFGPGQPLLSQSHGILGRLVGGWEVSSIWAFQSGTPLPLGSYSATAATNNGDYFLIDDPSKAVRPLGDRSPDRWFNTTPFVTASAAQPVSHFRVNPYRFSGLRGQRQNNVDFALIKDTRITESTKMRFSAQAMNAMNHALFPAAQMGMTSAQLGQISSSTQYNYPRRMQFELK
ncbi:MAG: TonB-dependent receptor, partial [Acidobacteria bacterium]|nr:TonB-dependent receptor [Acidobacteriota bacterium]